MKENYKELDTSKVILITGGAGFIGFHLTKALLNKGIKIIGYDNMNSYYDIKLKEDRLAILKQYKNYVFVKGDLADRGELEQIFKIYNLNVVINLAAQAGVRYSIDNPETYIQSNIIGFYNVLECCRYYPVEHLVYASSSSVYGENEKVPFSIEDKVDNPLSLYAATKKSNELMAHCYSKLYNIPATGLRFFTVYGPFGRPDMAYFSFTKKIIEDKPIKIFNNGDMYRDFTYIDDIIKGIENILCNPPEESNIGIRYKIYNIGNSKPESLIRFVNILEECIGKKANKEFLPMQQGDVYQTYADITELTKDFGFKPSTSIKKGIAKFIDWYKDYYEI